MTLARLKLSAGLAAAALVAAGTAAAQTYPQTSRYPPSSYDRPASAQDDAYDRSRPNGYAPQRDNRYDDRQADRGGYGDRAAPGQADGGEPDLGRALNLSSGQRAALEAYKAAFRPDEAAARAAEDMARRLPTMTTPQRLDFTRREMERERADFERTDAATRRFYAQLTAEQRRTFDQLTAPQEGGDEDEGPSANDPSARR